MKLLFSSYQMRTICANNQTKAKLGTDAEQELSSQHLTNIDT